MSTLLIFFLKVIVIQAILYLMYMLLFHKSGWHSFNRIFIISSLFISFLIPMIQLPTYIAPAQGEELEQATYWFTTAESQLAQVELIPVEKVQSSISILQLVLGLVLLVGMLLVIKLIIHYFQFFKIKRKSTLISKSWYNLYKSPYKSAFSFFNNVYLPAHLFESTAFQQVLAHECSHVKLRHSLDRMLMEFLIAIQWFNPILYWFRNRLIEVHEFQADESVIRKFKDPISYQEILYNQLARSASVAFANHFNFSTIKKRIKMMNKTQKLSGWIYSFSLPVILLLVLVFSDKDDKQAFQELKTEVETLMPDFDLSQRYEPSILPLKLTDKVAITAPFGLRMHPILKVEKLHEGVDFRTPVGNPVLATADGVVTVQSTTFGGFGRLITIDHNGVYETVYAHLSESIIKKGDQVSRGQVIGYSGNSGQSLGPHLHYEVIEKGKGHIDPIKFIQDFELRSSNE